MNLRLGFCICSENCRLPSCPPPTLHLLKFSQRMYLCVVPPQREIQIFMFDFVLFITPRSTNQSTERWSMKWVHHPDPAVEFQLPTNATNVRDGICLDFAWHVSGDILFLVRYVCRHPPGHTLSYKSQTCYLLRTPNNHGAFQGTYIFCLHTSVSCSSIQL